jgi:hypothetical protein
MNPSFCSLIPITHVVYLARDDYRPPVMAWMSQDEKIQLFVAEIDAEDVDDTEDSWKLVEEQLPNIVGYLTPVLRVSFVLALQSYVPR